MKVNTREFEAALKKILEYTSRDFPDVINGAARDVIIQAAMNTYKADPSHMVGYLSSGVFTGTHS